MPATILVVEDDPHLRSVISEALSHEGYRVRQASDGIFALHQVRSEEPDLVLSDVRLPRLNGAALAERLANRAEPVPVILMSSNPAPHGCVVPFLPKPFNLETLCTLIARVLEKRAS